MSPLQNIKVSRILVVDDDEMLNFLFCSFLDSKGFETISATSVASAKHILESSDDIDLILLDYQLADGVGMEVLAPEAIARYQRMAPVIMISANEEPEFLEQCFAGGVNDYIIKPVNLSLLALKVEALIKSVSMQKLIREQNAELENFKSEAEREELVAKFTYEYLLRQSSHDYQGVNVWLKSFAAFSGDMTLVKKSPSGNLYCILADATGHGLSAAITIMPVVTIFNSMVSKGFHVQRIATEINRKLVTDTPSDRFVAAILFEINPFRRELTVWNGGMPPLYWIDQGQIAHEFKSMHMSLGIMDDDMFDATVVTVDLPESGFIFSYTDGLNEQENTEGEQFGVPRIKNIIAQQPENLIEELSSALQLHANGEAYTDDVSVCVIEPKIAFGDLNLLEEVIAENKPVKKAIGVFGWQLTLAGAQLEHCEIPPMCNNFLQQMGVDQQLCQKIFAVIAEMVSNALDHGVLKLTSDIKENPDGFVEYFQEREARMQNLTDKDFVRIALTWVAENEGKLIVEVEDSGEGYFTAEQQGADAPKFSGRGNHLIRHLSESVEIFSPGNKIRATIK